VDVFLTSALLGNNDQLNIPAALPPRKETPVPIGNTYYTVELKYRISPQNFLFIFLDGE
jgi:hypothetical protein